jgi:hypothetical protein
MLLDELERALRAGGTRADRARTAAEAIRRAGGFHWVGLYDVTDTEIAALACPGPLTAMVGSMSCQGACRAPIT